MHANPSSGSMDDRAPSRCSGAAMTAMAECADAHYRNGMVETAPGISASVAIRAAAHAREESRAAVVARTAFPFLVLALAWEVTAQLGVFPPRLFPPMGWRLSWPRCRALSGANRKGKLYIRIFPNKPKTARPLETRMGKGKGEPDHWVAVVKPGTVMFEIAGASKDAARECFNRVAHKLGVRVRLVERTPGT